MNVSGHRRSWLDSSVGADCKDVQASREKSGLGAEPQKRMPQDDGLSSWGSSTRTDRATPSQR